MLSIDLMCYARFASRRRIYLTTLASFLISVPPIHLTQTSSITSSCWSCRSTNGACSVKTCICKQNVQGFSPLLDALAVVHRVLWNCRSVWQPGRMMNRIDIPAAANQQRNSANNCCRIQTRIFELQCVWCIVSCFTRPVQTSWFNLMILHRGPVLFSLVP